MSDTEERVQHPEEESEGEEGSSPRHKPTYVPNMAPPRLNMAPPRLPEGEKLDFEDLQRRRLEKDFSDLQTLIELHFCSRQKEEDELHALRGRMERRRSDRAEQQRSRAEQERARQARLAEERSQREEEAARLREEEAKKKKMLSSRAFGGYLQKTEQRGGRKLTAREEKQKALLERRRPLSIEHLNQEKLAEKARDLWGGLRQLHADKFDMAEQLRRQKYEIHVLRNRVSDHQRGGKLAKTPRGGAKAKSGARK